MPARIALLPYAEGLQALRGGLAASRGDDPLAPATVVVPSRRAATFLRRALAGAGAGTGRRGLVGVRFLTLAELAGGLAGTELLAAGRRPLTRTVLGGALRAVLAAAPGRFAPVALHPATEDELARCYEELRRAGPGATAALAAAGGGRAGEVARLCTATRERLAPGYFDDTDLAEAARTALLTGRAAPPAGSILVHLPERLEPPETRLVAALGEVAPLRVLVGLVGDLVADQPVRRLVEDLQAAGGELEPGGPALPRGGPPDPLAAASPLPLEQLVVAAEPESEVRAALRLVVAALEAGTPPERCALVAPVAGTYLPLLASALGSTALAPLGGGPAAAAGLAWQGPAPTPLAASPAATVLLGLLGLAGGEALERRAVLAWLASGPVRDRRGRPADLAGWERCSRLAGVVGGPPARWRWHLESLAAERERSVPRTAPAGEAPAPPVSGTAAACRALAEEVEELGVRCQAARHARSWQELAGWSLDVLGRYLGSPSGRGDGAPPVDDAEALVVTLLGELADLDAIGAPFSLGAFATAFERACRRPGPPAGQLGRGVLVGPLEAVAVGSFELVVVLGCVEGDLPGRAEPGALLRPADRQPAGLPPVGPGAALERDRRQLAVALAGARRLVACLPEHDGPGGRVRSPSRFLPRGLPAGRAPGLVGALALVGGGAPALSGAELELAALGAAALGGPAADRRLASHPLAGALGLAAGLEIVAARSRHRFGRFAGALGQGPLVASLGAERPLSATSLEAYATCPFRFLLASVLRCEVIEEPERRLEIDPRERGSIVHEVLERFVREQLPAPDGSVGVPPQEDDPAAAARLVALAEETFARYERLGRTGKPVLWALERERLLGWLERERRADARRQAAGWRPVAVELAFGYGGHAPVERRSAGQPVRFRGFIDRVDEGPEGAVRVVDYKTGTARAFRGIPDDPVDRGRHLQLPLYALAARDAFAPPPTAPPPRAAFRVLGDEQLEVEVVLDPAVERRLDEVLGVMVRGVEAGRFPIRPGEADRDSFEHCRWCDFDALCPGDRDRYWEAARAEPALGEYLVLAEGAPGDD